MEDKIVQVQIQNTTVCATNPCPVDCTWSPWGLFGPCSVTCVSGTSTQNRSTIGPFYGGTNCIGVSSNTTLCVPAPCPIDCVGNWSLWSACNCLTQTQTRLYSISIPAQYGGAPCSFTSAANETQSCIVTSCVPVDCVGSWGPWGNCDCNTLTQSQTYTISLPSANGGKACPASNGAINNRTCPTNTCPVNCQGVWSTAPSCDCTTNTTSQTYTILVQSLNGGAQCPFPDNKTNITNCIPTQCAPINCVGAWGSWSNCSCITNTTFRTFLVTTPASNGGTPCNPPTVQTDTKNCTCGTGSSSNSGMPPWEIALIALGATLALLLAGAITYGVFISESSSGFDVV